LRGEAEAQVEEEAEQICPICYDTVLDDSKLCRFA
jgi:hypothetical protein